MYRFCWGLLGIRRIGGVRWIEKRGVVNGVDEYEMLDCI